MRKPPLIRSVLLPVALAGLVGCGTSGPADPDPDAGTPANVVVSPDAVALTSIGETSALSTTVTDANGDAVTGAAVGWGSGNTAVATVSAGGVVTAVADGSTTVTATAGTASGSASITVAQAPAALAFTSAPSAGTAGAALSSVRVEVRDARGSRAAAATTAVTLTLGANPGPGVLSGTTVAAAVGGVATFDDLSIDVAADGYTLVAAAGALTGATTAPFDVSAPPVPHTVRWIAGGGGAWTDGAKWSDGAPPSSGDTAVIDADGTYTVTADGPVAVAVLEVGGGTGTQTLETGAATLAIAERLAVGPSGALRVTADATVGAATEVEGTLAIAAGVLRLTGAVTMADGAVLQGSGSLDVSAATGVAFDADVRPGSSPGVLTVVGDLALSASSTVRLEIEGTLPGTGHDVLAVSGTLAMAGTLELVVGGGYTPTEGDTLRVITYGASSGAFADTVGLAGMTFEADATGADAIGPPAGPVLWTAVAGGSSHTCGLRSGGIAYCWGLNNSAQLGIDSLTSVSVPVRVATDERFTSLTGGRLSTCGVSEVGTGWCWGSGSSGVLGIGVQGGMRSTPTEVSGGLTFTTIQIGSWLTACGITTSAELYCWGANQEGQIGDGTTINRLVPTRVDLPGPVARVAVGYAHVCALLDGGDGYCWGSGGAGQLGADVFNTPTPIPSPAVDGAVEIEAGWGSTCAIRPSRIVECWGDGSRNGVASSVNDYMPVQIDFGGTAQSLTLFGGSCLIDAQSAGQCWGQNDANGLGLGPDFAGQTPVPVPLPIIGGLRWSVLSQGDYHGCGVTLDGEMYCWGSNQYGQVGVDTAVVNPDSPTRVSDPG